MATITIPIKGTIGKDTTAKGVEALLKANPEAKEVMLEVDSLGGAVFEGFSIYNMLINSGLRIKAKIVGLAGSIVTLIVSSAEPKDIEMNEVGMWIIHNPSVGLEGDANKLDSASEGLKQIEQVMVDVYAKRMNATPEEIKEKMNAETSFSSKEAKKAGLVGTVAKKLQLKPVALFDPDSLNKKDNSVLTELMATVKKMAEKLLAPDVKNALNLTLADGGTVYVDTEAETVAVGDKVFTDAEMTAAAAAGDYALESGVLVVVGEEGAVTEVKEPQTEEAMKELQAKIKELEAEMKKVNDAKAKAEETEKKYTALLKKVEDTAPPKPVDYSKMNHEGEGHFMDADVKAFANKMNQN